MCNNNLKTKIHENCFNFPLWNVSTCRDFACSVDFLCSSSRLLKIVVDCGSTAWLPVCCFRTAKKNWFHIRSVRANWRVAGYRFVANKSHGIGSVHLWEQRGRESSGTQRFDSITIQGPKTIKQSSRCILSWCILFNLSVSQLTSSEALVQFTLTVNFVELKVLPSSTL